MNECSACSAETRVFACKSWLRAELEEEYTASFWSGAAKRDRPLKERRDVPVSRKKTLLRCFVVLVLEQLCGVEYCSWMKRI